MIDHPARKFSVQRARALLTPDAQEAIICFGLPAERNLTPCAADGPKLSPQDNQMTPPRSKGILFVILSLALSSAAIGASGAERIVASAQAAKQGQLKAEPANEGSKSIPIKKFLFEVGRPHDGVRNTGKWNREYKPIVLTKEVGASSPQFLAALLDDELLTNVTIEFLRPERDGREIVYYTVKLTNATVMNIRQYTGEGADAGKQLEEVSLTFQRIEITEHSGKVSKVDVLAKPDR
jgi:type VI secretion system secreted protein Hcp